jgi:DNA polymerase-3 subunit alpha
LFIHLHTHDAKGSLLDSIIKPEQLAEFAKANGQFAIANTNHGLMTSFVDFVKACKKNNIKSIIGCEIYEVDNMNEKSDSKEYQQPRYHLILLCKTQQGLQNLFKIVSIANTDGRKLIGRRFNMSHSMSSWKIK